jgi:hypothetical protein
VSAGGSETSTRRLKVLLVSYPSATQPIAFEPYSDTFDEYDLPSPCRQEAGDLNDEMKI